MHVSLSNTWQITVNVVLMLVGFIVSFSTLIVRIREIEIKMSKFYTEEIV